MALYYKEFQPHPLLARYIKCYWILEGHKKLPSPKAERILPDGCMELIFHLNDPVKRQTVDSFETQPRSFVSGQIRRYILLEPTGQLGVMGIRFQPAGAAAFFRVPMLELAEQTVGLDLIWGNPGKELESRVMETRTHCERVRQMEAWLIRQIDPRHNSDGVVDAAISAIISAQGEISMDTLLRKLPVSGRQLERKFNEKVGLTPKLFSRIIRFQKIFKLIAKNGPQRLTPLALDCGYYDQSHFIREFKEFSGVNPAVYFTQTHRMSDFFTSSNGMSDLYNSNF